jgi:hypothetical protein
MEALKPKIDEAND